MPILTQEELREALRAHPGWRLEDGRLVRELHFRDFPEALRFLTVVAESAEDYERHPDVGIHDQNRVRLTVGNPRGAGVTEAELRLAGRVEELLAAGPDPGESTLPASETARGEAAPEEEQAAVSEPPSATAGGEDERSVERATRRSVALAGAAGALIGGLAVALAQARARR